MVNTCIPALRFAATLFCDLKPVGSLSSQTSNVRVRGQVRVNAVFTGPSQNLPAAAPFHVFGTTIHIRTRPLPTPAATRADFAPGL